MMNFKHTSRGKANLKWSTRTLLHLFQSEDYNYWAARVNIIVRKITLINYHYDFLFSVCTKHLFEFDTIFRRRLIHVIWSNNIT